MEAVDETQSGLLLLLLGMILTAFPIIRLAGVLVSLSAIVLIVQARQRFGPAHSYLVEAGTLLFVAGAVLALLSSAGYIFLTFALSCESIPWYSGCSDAFRGITVFTIGMVQAVPLFLALYLGGTVFLGSSYALFTYQLQKSKGRLLLWLGFLINLVTASLIFLTLDSIFSNDQWTNGWNPALDFEKLLVGSNLLNLVPVGILAAAFRLAHSRLNYPGDIPHE